MSMKRSVLALALLLVVGAATTYAQEVKFARLGPAIGMTAGGDVDNAFAFGLQGEVSVGEHLGVELSYMRFENQNDVEGMSLDMDQDTIGLSVVGRKNLVEDLSGYLLGGLNYNMVNGGPDVDDELGIHLGFGFNMKSGDFSELFIEYRYTFLELSGDLPGDDSWDSDFGLLKLGMNFVF